MHYHMRLQVVLTIKQSVADMTRISTYHWAIGFCWLIHRVSDSMLCLFVAHAQRFRYETLLAMPAAECLNAQMASLVVQHGLLGAKRLSTLTTFVWFYVRMTFQVRRQIAAHLEALSADGTRESMVARVLGLVLDETDFGSKLFGAAWVGALEGQVR